MTWRMCGPPPQPPQVTVLTANTGPWSHRRSRAPHLALEPAEVLCFCTHYHRSARNDIVYKDHQHDKSVLACLRHSLCHAATGVQVGGQCRFGKSRQRWHRRCKWDACKRKGLHGWMSNAGLCRAKLLCLGLSAWVSLSYEAARMYK